MCVWILFMVLNDIHPGSYQKLSYNWNFVLSKKYIPDSVSWVKKIIFHTLTFGENKSRHKTKLKKKNIEKWAKQMIK